jgi:alkaline phosphatase D
MKTRVLILLLSVTSFWTGIQAQIAGFTQRSSLNPELEPFYHGVASGDPATNSIILWTRVTPRAPESVEVLWRMARDTTFSNTIRSGSVVTDESRDWTVKITVDGLEPNTWYYYEFNAYGKNSLTGRTKTAPDGSVNQLRFATVSCSNYNAGYFNVYDRIAERNDLDAVIHLGDYIYEYAGGISDLRVSEPDKEILNLADYRLRYSTYRLDSMSIKMHQQYPLIATWDDHEITNNTWRDGAQNHQADEGNFQDRKNAAQTAHDEWMPTRLPEPGNIAKLWRKVSYGNLADIFVIDTRHFDRDEENPNLVDDPNRVMLGAEQFAWLEEGLKNSTAKWKVIAQQVMMAPLTPFGLTLNPDQWDGYTVERKKLYDVILNNNIQNVVVLTGDIHTAWANDLPYNRDDYAPVGGRGSVGVEFVCTSVSSGSSPVFIPPSLYGIVRTVLPHVKYVDLFRKGYSLLDLTDEKAVNNFYTIQTVRAINNFQKLEQAWFVREGRRNLQKQPEASELIGEPQYQAPPLPRTSTVTPVFEQENAVLISTYPNPFISHFQIQYNLFKESRVIISIYNQAGQLMLSRDLGTLPQGLHFEVLDGRSLPNGMYRVILQSENQVLERAVVKM